MTRDRGFCSKFENLAVFSDSFFTGCQIPFGSVWKALECRVDAWRIEYETGVALAV